MFSISRVSGSGVSRPIPDTERVPTGPSHRVLCVVGRSPSPPRDRARVPELDRSPPPSDERHAERHAAALPVRRPRWWNSSVIRSADLPLRKPVRTADQSTSAECVDAVELGADRCRRPRLPNLRSNVPCRTCRADRRCAGTRHRWPLPASRVDRELRLRSLQSGSAWLPAKTVQRLAPGA